jgi:6-phosphogluconolactonase
LLSGRCLVILERMIALRGFDDAGAWTRAVVEDFIDALESAYTAGRSPLFCLAGGTTPTPAYRAISAALVARPASPHGPARLVVGDERSSPRSPGDRNESMIRDAFSAALAAGAVEIVGWSVESGRAAAIERMTEFVERLRNAPGVLPGEPLFDACYLGLGPDGHTAGIFTGQTTVAGATVAVACLAPSEPRERVSLSLSTLASTRRTRFIVRSAGKEDALRRLAGGDRSSPAVLAAAESAIAFVKESDL